MALALAIQPLPMILVAKSSPIKRGDFAVQHPSLCHTCNVAFWHKADIREPPIIVRYYPEADIRRMSWHVRFVPIPDLR
jgi:hypothetical protein